MQYLILLEQTETGFAVQVPDLAISAYGSDIPSAKNAAAAAIRINLETYEEIGKPVPRPLSPVIHLNNPDFADLMFCYVDIAENEQRMAE